MDTRQLRHFVALVEIGTAHAAADDQHISQPGLSSSIKRLEQQLGVALFERKGRGMVLNARGRDFYPHAKRILENLRLADAEIKRANAKIRIGVGDIRESDFIAKLTSKLLDIFPALATEFYESDYEKLYSRLEDGTIDLAFVGVPANTLLPSSFISTSLTSSEFKVFCAVDHPLNELERPIVNSDLESYPWMTNINAPSTTPHLPRLKDGRALSKTKLKMIGVDSLHMGKEIVINSDCLCHVPELAMALEVSAGKVAQLDLTLRKYETEIMALRLNSIRSPLLDQIFSLAENCFDQ